MKSDVLMPFRRSNICISDTGRSLLGYLVISVHLTNLAKIQVSNLGFRVRLPNRFANCLPTSSGAAGGRPSVSACARGSPKASISLPGSGGGHGPAPRLGPAWRPDAALHLSRRGRAPLPLGGHRRPSRVGDPLPPPGVKALMRISGVMCVRPVPGRYRLHNR